LLYGVHEALLAISCHALLALAYYLSLKNALALAAALLLGYRVQGLLVVIAAALIETLNLQLEVVPILKLLLILLKNEVFG
jgi:hypothetical protein